jgi:hypothetical protein
MLHCEPFPCQCPPLEPVCFVDASYGGLLPIEDHCSITGIVICIGVTAIFVKMRIQSTMTLSSMEADAGKDIKYWRKLFHDLHLDIHQPTYVDKDNDGTIVIVNHNHTSVCTRHPDSQHFATQEWVQRGLVRLIKIDGTANP